MMTHDRLAMNDQSKFDSAVFFSLLAGIVIASLIVSVYVGAEIGKWFVIRVGGTTLAGVWFSVRLLSGKTAVRWDAISLLLLGSVAVYFLSIPGTVNPYMALTTTSKMVALLAIYFLVFNLIRNTSDRDKVIWTMIVTGVLLASYGMAQHWGYDFFPWIEHHHMPMDRGPSFLGHPTFVASVYLLLIPLAFGMGFRVRALPARAMAFGSALLMLYHLSFSGARTASVALVCAAVAATLARLYKGYRSRSAEVALSKTRVTAVALILCTGLLAGSVLIQRAWETKGSDALGIRQSALALRLYHWETASRMISESPIRGIGAGQYEIVSPEYWNDVERTRKARLGSFAHEVHNEYLEAAVELGLAGIFLLLLILAYAVTMSVQLFLSATNTQEQRLGLAYFAAIVGIALDACLNFPFQISTSALHFHLLLGLISWTYATQMKKPEAQVA